MTREFKIVHIADIHWRGLTRHDEYHTSFSKFFEMVKEQQPDVIYVGGDIVHSKTQGISPELIDNLNWWFSGLAEICPVHVILGNHDGILHNKRRQDAISPILSALNNSNIHLYKKSGTYPTGLPGVNWAVFSCFDEDGWKQVIPVEGEINIALFHGAVHGSLTDIDWALPGEIEADFFDGFDFVMLGDIHRHQFLNEEKTIAYSGSTIQQNYGESVEKGYLLWRIRSNTDFDVEFHAVPATMPFVTIDWAGSVKDTIGRCKKYPAGSRFRIRSSDSIPQVEVGQLQNELRTSHRAAEVVFKFDTDVDINQISTAAMSLFKKDLRDATVHFTLLREFLGKSSHSAKEWGIMKEMLREYLGRASRDDKVARNTKWSIKKLEFDNIFSFGGSNVIDFSKLGGVTGIFAPNASGKSSIVGAIMYCLFNTTDRGPIKNLHVINGRKNFCRVGMDIRIDNKQFRVERQTVRHEDRRGKQHGVTNLNFYQEKSPSDIIDKTGEQRIETEKVIRKLIGTAEDFLLTSFASQGEMNKFIQEGATQRKRTLAKFLDLTIFEKIYEYAKSDSTEIKLKLKNAPDRDWDSIIREKKAELESFRDLIIRKDEDLASKRADLLKLTSSLAKFDNTDVVTLIDIRNQERSINGIEDLLKTRRIEIGENVESLSALMIKIDRIVEFKLKFPIDELRENLQKQGDLRRAIVDLRHLYEKETTVLNNQRRSIEILDQVPCGDTFPTCKFIKNSHENKAKVKEQEAAVVEHQQQLQILETSLNEFIDDGIEAKISKYEKLLRRQHDMTFQMSDLELDGKRIGIEIESLEGKLRSLENDLAEMSQRITEDELDGEVIELKDRVSILSDEINQVDAERISAAGRVGELSGILKSLRSEKKKYADIRSRWKIYQNFMRGVSKRGIPSQIINSQLPVINTEIAKILNGVVDFTVEFDTQDADSAMDVYINYGDTRRIIELASGMEKMISSLAIRVALSNISSLPKTDMLLIDEGFGTLDENKVTACNQLLTSLKKWFKNIIVITHIDAVKDVADNILEIDKNGKDSKITFE